MAVVHIPAHMRTLSGGRDRVEVQGRTLRQVIEALAAACPGMRELLLDDDQIRPEMAIAIDGVVAESGLVEPVPEHAEIHLIPAIAGGH
ncbi:MAG: MoaD/ThiS family protein [Dehalococcoidia bacterium]|nr:MoaD/ThiS family protein [Dehalococcoidia bacterium]